MRWHSPRCAWHRAVKIGQSLYEKMLQTVVKCPISQCLGEKSHRSASCLADIRTHTHTDTVFSDHRGVQLIRDLCETVQHGITAFKFLQHRTLWQYSDGDPVTGALNTRAYEKNRDFDQYLAICHDTRYCHIYYRRRISNHTHAFELYHF